MVNQKERSKLELAKLNAEEMKLGQAQYPGGAEGVAQTIIYRD